MKTFVFLREMDLFSNLELLKDLLFRFDFNDVKKKKKKEEEEEIESGDFTNKFQFHEEFLFLFRHHFPDPSCKQRLLSRLIARKRIIGINDTRESRCRTWRIIFQKEDSMLATQPLENIPISQTSLSLRADYFLPLMNRGV